MLGSGGACKGISLYLTDQKVARIDLVARDENKGGSISSRIRQTGINSKYISWSDLKDLKIDDYDIIIQTTPLGMKNQAGQIEFPYEKLTSYKTVIDIIYNPLETDFLKKSKVYGAKCINGLEMLVYQGYHSFKIWTELEEDTELMLKAAYSLLEVKGE